MFSNSEFLSLQHGRVFLLFLVLKVEVFSFENCICFLNDFLG